MNFSRMVRFSLVLLLLCAVTLTASAQESQVPDLTGLTIPQAAAELNRVGLRLGKEVAVPITEGVTPDVISGQSFSPGSLIGAGAEVDIDIPRSPNVRLIYDDNDLTLINLVNANINIEEVTFETAESTQSASFNARRWAKQVRAKQCTQLWSVNRNGPKDFAECKYIQNWMTSTNRDVHFWTGANGVQTFRVMQGEAERATCNAAPPNSQDTPTQCEFYLPAGGNSDVTSHIYLAYRADRLAVINNTTDKWMPINTARIINGLADPAPFDREFRINAGLFGRPEIVARINRLAPNQCVLFYVEGAEADPIQNCDVIATYTLQASQLWWTANFEVQGSDDRRRTCTAAKTDKLTLCVMPR